MRVLELFAGVGGMALGFERAGFTHAAFVEIDPFCRAVLAHHWPEVPIHEDIRTFDATPFRGRVDVVTGGPPCQPASVAGKQKGSSDDRWLWPDYLRVVRECQPRFVVAENVPGIRGLVPHGADWICEQLEAEGYSVEAFVVGADDVGAPHRRKRVFFVAHRGHFQPKVEEGFDRQHDEWSAERGREQFDTWSGTSGLADSTTGTTGPSEPEPRFDGAGPGALAHRDGERRELIGQPELGRLERSSGNEPDRCRETGSGEVGGVGHADDSRLEGRSVPGCECPDERTSWTAGDEGVAHTEDTNWRGRVTGGEASTRERRPETGGSRWPARPGEQQHGWENPRTTQSGLGGAVDGLSRRLDGFTRRNRLKALGNAVVPQVAQVIAEAIKEVEGKG